MKRLALSSRKGFGLALRASRQLGPKRRVLRVESLESRLSLHADGNDDELHTHFDTIPNFAQNATTINVASGNWSDRTIWASGVVPAANDVVRIAPGTNVRYDVASDVPLEAVGVEGALKFADNRDTRMRVSNLIVYSAGTLEIGTESQPVAPNVKAEIVLRDETLQTGSLALPGNDPRQYSQALLVYGTARLHGAPLSETFVRLEHEVQAGQTTLETTTPMVGWRRGDVLFVPDTRHIDPKSAGFTPQGEEVVIQQIAGTTITLARPLSFSHLGARDADSTPTLLADGTRFMPHVANLSRNVVIRSENPDGVRGHTMWLDRADVDVRYARFQDLGRTLAAGIDNTTISTSGAVTHIGTNQIGRYPVHMHHLYGTENSSNTGYQYRLIGNSVTGSGKWGIALHDTSFGLVSDNVVYDIDGAGIVTEDGSEFENVIEHNFVAQINGGINARGETFNELGENEYDQGELGDGFWFAGPMNYVRDNVVADAVRTGFVLFPGNVGRIPSTSGRTVRVPSFRGADTINAQVSSIVDVSREAFSEFSRNEVYGTTTAAVTLWETGKRDEFAPYPQHPGAEGGEENVLHDTRVWHVAGIGIRFYYAVSYVIDGWVQRGAIDAFQGTTDDSLLGRAGATAMTFAGNAAQQVVIRRADIQGMYLGLLNRGRGNASLLRVEDSYFENYINVENRPWTQNPLRTSELANVRYGDRSHINVQMVWSPPQAQNIYRGDVNTIYNFDGIEGENFQVFYEAQAPSLVVPLPYPPNSSTTHPYHYLFPCSVDSLTNA